MGRMEWAVIAVSVGGLCGAVLILSSAVRIARRSPEDGVARFTSGYLGLFGCCLGLIGSLGLIGIAGLYVGSSLLALAVVVVLNLVAQPVALLVCWTAVRKLRLGLCGCVAYAWKRIPESTLADVPAPTRRALALHCVFQGLVTLPIGVAISLAFAAPLLQLAETVPGAAFDSGQVRCFHNRVAHSAVGEFIRSAP
jgi:hypothetical protein